MKINTLSDILRRGEREFIKAKLFFGHGTDNPWDEAVYLALHVLKLPYDADRSLLKRKLTPAEIDQILELYAKRIAQKIPAAYLVQEAWFAGLSFYVDQRVLIPRSPTAELIMQKFQPWIAKKRVDRILDLCTGSGCIAIACAMVFPCAVVDAIDIDKDALDVATINVKRHKVQKRVRLIRSDLFAAVESEKYDVIISNPPYVDAEDMTNLPIEYRHEPELALAAGQDGLVIIDRILHEAKKHLTPHGLLILEFGANISSLMKKYPHVPFIWPEFTNGGDGVLLLSAEDL